ncbi:hypothetical protein J5X98_13025 [Leptothermofonsia sichuanensis E412]|uniref:hypothetical protein n=1 Tax=Leptothermofonsia sichuanensis TaxID=2917832 RepID=UPI001CA69A12|nr:hypothetical protein [Leptothermofonsia sichuanensis]QZZ23171.1 hypothetical protein J5X98_13025 [Leptothermofonsia sichuanensis E412]
MTFNIRQLDNLTYEEVEPILEDYINDAILEFVQSPEGEAYTEDHPQGGSWIGSFIELAYLYDGYTLPRMTRGNVQSLMEHTLPRKITIFDPTEAEDAIPELVAFWQFLKREYQLRSAGAIVKYLESLAPQFPSIMCDPTRGGFAKAFLVMGHQAGFDMTTQEGVQAFQEQYNASLKSENADPTMTALQNMIQGMVPSSSSTSSIPSRSKSQGMGMPKTTPARKTARKQTRRKRK